MCVSAETSFAVGVGLSLTGVATLQCAGAKPLPWLASMPCLFAVQQGAEGVVWLYLNGGFQATPVSLVALYVYLMFALVFWPSYTPLAVGLSEKVPWRRRLCLIVLLGGICVSLFNSYDLLTSELSATVSGHSIQYGTGARILRMTYGSLSLLPFFIASIPKLWLLGVLSLTTFIIAEQYFPLTFISVWCFLAAVSSVVLFFVINNYGETEALPSS